MRTLAVPIKVAILASIQQLFGFSRHREDQVRKPGQILGISKTTGLAHFGHRVNVT